MDKKPNRFMALEGVRGLAAIAVVLHHYVASFYPFLDNGNPALAHSWVEEIIYGTPLALPFAGRLAVALFFVLSGFVLSIAFFQTGDRNIVKKLAASRYVRLMIPALASVLLASLLVSLGLHVFLDGAAAVTGSSWLGNKWEMDPNIFDALYIGAVSVFMESGSVPYNSVLWTMHIEFIGSFLVFAFLLFFAQSRYRWVAYAILALLTFGTWFLAFVIGMIIADMYSKGWLEKMRHPTIIAALLLGAGLLGSYPKEVTGFFSYVQLEGLDINFRTMSLIIAATCIMLAVLLSRRLGSWLARPRVSVLGRYTFSIYLTHLLVLYTFSTALFVALNNSVVYQAIGYHGVVFATVLISLPVLFIVTKLFERFVDAPAIRIAKRLTKVYQSRESSSQK